MSFPNTGDALIRSLIIRKQEMKSTGTGCPAGQPNRITFSAKGNVIQLFPKCIIGFILQMLFSFLLVHLQLVFALASS